MSQLITVIEFLFVDAMADKPHEYFGFDRTSLIFSHHLYSHVFSNFFPFQFGAAFLIRGLIPRVLRPLRRVERVA